MASKKQDKAPQSGPASETVLASARKPGPYGQTFNLVVLNPTYELTRDAAAGYNGLSAPSGRDIFAVGAGALGSQVLGNLARMGERLTAIVDQDRLFPHNLARHAAWEHESLGWPKAMVMAAMAGGLMSGAGQPMCFVVNAAGSRAGPPKRSRRQWRRRG